MEVGHARFATGQSAHARDPPPHHAVRVFTEFVTDLFSALGNERGLEVLMTRDDRPTGTDGDSAMFRPRGAIADRTEPLEHTQRTGDFAGRPLVEQFKAISITHWFDRGRKRMRFSPFDKTQECLSIGHLL